jgi:hypothetical protein
MVTSAPTRDSLSSWWKVASIATMAIGFCAERGFHPPSSGIRRIGADAPGHHCNALDTAALLQHHEFRSGGLDRHSAPMKLS